MPDKYERFVAAFLRLNGYFTVPNFVVHAADDPGRISGGVVGNHTEVDTIGIRLPHSIEMSGPKRIINFGPLVDGGEGRFDCVFAEVKSRANKPNSVWKDGKADPAISYMVRFVGYHDAGGITKVADALALNYQYVDDQSRYRYVVFATETNAHYAEKGVTYVTFREAIEFLVRVRGESWVEAGIGVASVHQQWDDLLNDLFAIANDHRRSPDDRVAAIENYLSSAAPISQTTGPA